jgi:nucleoside 2-deoxyribosyltransferase
MMKVYLAAPYGARTLVAGLATELPQVGMRCTSTWLEEQHEITPGTEAAATALDDATVSGHAVQDLADVSRSDVLVLFTAAYFGVEGGGGRHIETGYALAMGKPIIVIGEPENIFHRIGSVPERNFSVTIVADWHQAILQLIRLGNLPAYDVLERGRA